MEQHAAVTTVEGLEQQKTPLSVAVGDVIWVPMWAAPL
jgi:hypothetical protein